MALTNAVRDGLLEAFLNPFNQQALAQSQGVTAEQLTDLTKHGVCLLGAAGGVGVAAALC